MNCAGRFNKIPTKNVLFFNYCQDTGALKAGRFGILKYIYNISILHFAYNTETNELKNDTVQLGGTLVSMIRFQIQLND